MKLIQFSGYWDSWFGSPRIAIVFCLSLSFVLLFCVVLSKNVACHKKNHRLKHRHRSHMPVIQANLTQTGDSVVLSRLMLLKTNLVGHQ